MILSALTDYDTRLHARRDRRAPQEENQPPRLALDDRDVAGEYKQHCSYRRLRAEGLARFPANQTIRSIKLYHRQVYGYRLPPPEARLPARRHARRQAQQATRASRPLADFLESSPDDLPARSLHARRGSESARLAGSTGIRRRLARSSSIAKRTRRPTRPRSSFRPSATTSCVTKRCSASCSPTTA